MPEISLKPTVWNWLGPFDDYIDPAPKDVRDTLGLAEIGEESYIQRTCGPISAAVVPKDVIFNRMANHKHRRGNRKGTSIKLA